MGAVYVLDVNYVLVVICILGGIHYLGSTYIEVGPTNILFWMRGIIWMGVVFCSDSVFWAFVIVWVVRVVWDFFRFFVYA